MTPTTDAASYTRLDEDLSLVTGLCSWKNMAWQQESCLENSKLCVDVVCLICITSAVPLRGLVRCLYISAHVQIKTNHIHIKGALCRGQQEVETLQSISSRASSSWLITSEEHFSAPVNKRF